MMECKLPSVLTFTHHLLRNLVFSSIAYAVLCIDGQIKYITSEVLTSKHDLLYGQSTTYCKWFKRVYYEDFEYLKKYLNAHLVVNILIVKIHQDIVTRLNHTGIPSFVQESFTDGGAYPNLIVNCT
jgi:hypothetical protein